MKKLNASYALSVALTEPSEATAACEREHPGKWLTPNLMKPPPDANAARKVKSVPTFLRGLRTLLGLMRRTWLA